MITSCPRWALVFHEKSGNCNTVCGIHSEPPLLSTLFTLLYLLYIKLYENRSLLCNCTCSIGKVGISWKWNSVVIEACLQNCERLLSVICVFWQVICDRKCDSGIFRKLAGIYISFLGTSFLFLTWFKLYACLFWISISCYLMQNFPSTKAISLSEILKVIIYWSHFVRQLRKLISKRKSKILKLKSVILKIVFIWGCGIW